MADVYIVVFSVIGILISFPGLAAGLNLLLPRATEAAYLRLAYTPWKTFMLGLPVTGLFSLFIIVTANIDFGPVKALAFFTFLVLMGIAAIGAAALARLMGERIEALNLSGTSLSNLIRGAIILELASLFPLIGWFLVTPIVAITVVGAAVFGLIGWAPKRKPVQEETASEVTAFTPIGTHG